MYIHCSVSLAVPEELVFWASVGSGPNVDVGANIKESPSTFLSFFFSNPLFIQFSHSAAVPLTSLPPDSLTPLHTHPPDLPPLQPQCDGFVLFWSSVWHGETPVCIGTGVRLPVNAAVWVWSKD